MESKIKNIGAGNKSKKKTDWQKNIFLIIILFVPITNFLVFWLYINFDSILMAFQTKNEFGKIVWSFQNFDTFFNDLKITDSAFWQAFKNTMTFFGFDLLIILPVSLVLCYFLYKKVKGYTVFRVIFYLPSLISASVLVIVFKYVIAMNGPLGYLTTLLGGTPKSLLFNKDTAFSTILFYYVFTGLGGNIILFSGAMNHINSEIVEAARIDGCGVIRELLQITIPLIWPTFSTLIIFAFVGMFSTSGPIILFLKDKAIDFGCNTLSYWIYSQVYYSGEYYYSATIGFVLTLIGLPIALSVKKILTNKIDAGEM